MKSYGNTKTHFLQILSSLALFAFLFTASPVLAHRSPAGCSGSGLGIELYATPQQVPIGGVVSYSVTVYNGNGGPVSCDATGIQAFIVTPDGQSHPLALVRTTLSNGQFDVYSDVVSYTARAQDVSAGGILAATANDTGDVHQNNTDSRGGGFQGLNVTIGTTPPPPVVPPPPVTPPPSSFAPLPLIDIVKIAYPPSLPSGPGSVTFSYSVINTATVTMRGVWVKDDKCSPVTFVSGDANSDSLLQVGESWLFECTKIVSQTETNIAITHGQANGWDTYDTASTTVVVSLPPPPVPQFFTPPIIPNFPNAGVSPTLTSVFVAKTDRPGMPVRLLIPQIGVDAEIESVNITSNGALAVPKGPTRVGWFDLGARPGEVGTAVIDGHFGWYKKQPAVFDNLRLLRQGDKISVVDDAGVTVKFVVREVKTFAWNEDTQSVFTSNDGKAHLNLITCGGLWDTVLNMFSRRVVVFAERE